MSEIHVGDTVHVSYEAPVTKLTPSTVEVTDAIHGRKVFLRKEAELVKSPLPTSFGSVVALGVVMYVYDGTVWANNLVRKNWDWMAEQDYRVIRVGIENAN